MLRRVSTALVPRTTSIRSRFTVLHRNLTTTLGRGTKSQTCLVPKVHSHMSLLLSPSPIVQAGGSQTRSGQMSLGLGKQIRKLNVHEYQAMELFNKYGVGTPRCKVAASPAEAETIAEEIGGSDFVVKAQILAGGRGKGTFTNGFKGGVHPANSALEARSLAAKMLNHRLVTKQSGPEGKLVNKVLVTERLYLRRETYFAILMDRETQGPVLVASSQGGMDIEQVAAQSPKSIVKEAVDIYEGVKPEQLDRLANAMGFGGKPSTLEAAKENMKRLYELFIKSDATLVEINPMVETHDGKILCADGKLNFDDNAEFRQPDIFALRDISQMDEREIVAEKVGLNYIGLDGNIGCLVNGAGLAMATLDVIKLHGGNPANFLDMGGGATATMVTEAFKLLNSDPHVKAILVNIFGGIMRCDVIALGLIKAVTELNMKKPLVVRLQGTNMEAAKQLIDESGLRMLTAVDLEDAAQKAVRVVQIMKMAEDAKLSVAFELPL